MTNTTSATVAISTGTPFIHRFLRTLTAGFLPK
jgi:hypothetical protein